MLKGQELINSAKVKNMANDFKNAPIYIYGYQDKFKALPGDDAAAIAHLGVNATVATGGTPGLIDGAWDSVTTSDESILFWQHVRLAGLAPGSTAIGSSVNGFVPTNSDGGRVGVSGVVPINGMTGSMRAVQTASPPAAVGNAVGITSATTGKYTLCQAF